MDPSALIVLLGKEDRVLMFKVDSVLMCFLSPLLLQNEMLRFQAGGIS